MEQTTVFEFWQQVTPGKALVIDPTNLPLSPDVHPVITKVCLADVENPLAGPLMIGDASADTEVDGRVLHLYDNKLWRVTVPPNSKTIRGATEDNCIYLVADFDWQHISDGHRIWTEESASHILQHKVTDKMEKTRKGMVHLGVRVTCETEQQADDMYTRASALNPADDAVKQIDDLNVEMGPNTFPMLSAAIYTAASRRPEVVQIPTGKPVGRTSAGPGVVPYALLSVECTTHEREDLPEEAVEEVLPAADVTATGPDGV